MYDSGKDLVDALAATPEALEALLAGVTQAQARAARGGDENWSVVEIVCHLRDAETRALEREQAMRDEPHPFLAAYDQEVWAAERDYAGQDLRAALDEFQAVRARRLAFLTTLTPDEWQRVGRHEEQGDITLQAHVIHIVAHDLVHLAQLGRQLRGSRA